MTKIPMVLKTSIFLFLLSMTQNLYAGTCQSMISEEESIHFTLRPSDFSVEELEYLTESRKQKAESSKEQIERFVRTFKGYMTRSGLDMSTPSKHCYKVLSSIR